MMRQEDYKKDKCEHWYHRGILKLSFLPLFRNEAGILVKGKENV